MQLGGPDVVDSVYQVVWLLAGLVTRRRHWHGPSTKHGYHCGL